MMITKKPFDTLLREEMQELFVMLTSLISRKQTHYSKITQISLVSNRKKTKTDLYCV